MIDSARLAAIPSSRYDGHAYRHQSPSYDPRSGEGARLHGGRFNPPDSFPALYLCETRPCAVAELERLGRRHGLGVGDLLPRHLYRYTVGLTSVLDLSDDDVLKHLGLARDVLVGDSWQASQEVGVAAHRLGWQAVRSPSATGVDLVLAVFPELLGGGVLEPELVERWEQRRDL